MYTIGQVSERFDLPVSTLRYYDKEGLFPALTLGCGAVGGSSSSNNISPLDLINIRRVAWDLGESSTVSQGGAAAGAVNAELVELLTEKILQRLGE